MSQHLVLTVQISADYVRVEVRGSVTTTDANEVSRAGLCSPTELVRDLNRMVTLHIC